MAVSAGDACTLPLVAMSAYEEHLLLQKLGRYLELERAGNGKDNPMTARESVSIRRLYRKLVVRKTQRRNNRAPFDLSRDLGLTVGDRGNVQLGLRALERYQQQQQQQAVNGAVSAVAKDTADSLLLVPQPVSLPVVSSYTGRQLKPFVRRDVETEPLKIRLHQELLGRVGGGGGGRRLPIDFCYVQKQHVASINGLATKFFWPGIDVSEALEHPDFSCIALYGQLVVGFAFLLPNVSHTEAYITFIFVHPDWRRAGIAKFFLYHLIQTCAGRDVILHVSANNPAVMLYQKFGFKVEERIAGFYEKYLPAESKECKDALFLRLAR